MEIRTAEARSPHKNDIPPRFNLVLYTDETIDEPAVMGLRAALREVNGVLVGENWTLRIAAAGRLGSKEKDEQHGFNEIVVTREGNACRVAVRRFVRQNDQFSRDKTPGPFTPGKSQGRLTVSCEARSW